MVNAIKTAMVNPSPNLVRGILIPEVRGRLKPALLGSEEDLLELDDRKIDLRGSHAYSYNQIFKVNCLLDDFESLSYLSLSNKTNDEPDLNWI